MMGRIMDKNIRRGLITILAVLVLGSAGFTFWWFIQPTEEETKVPFYTCTQQAKVDYRVFFNPNNFFPEPIAGPGQAYITPLTQYIETTFNYRFSGEVPADISGQYQVDAALTGYMLKETEGSKDEEKQKIKVWSKAYPLLPATPFSAHDKQLAINQVIPVDIRSYAVFADQVAKELKFSADLVELTVNYHVQGGSVTPEGKVSESLNTVLLIPIDGSAFMVGGLLADKKDSSITKSQTKAVSGVKTTRAGFAAATGLLALMLLLVIFRTKAKIEDPAEKELKTIIKKHGDRIVAGVFDFPETLEKNTVFLQSFTDLVRVADEVAQPILYENMSVEIHSFYVINKPLIYHYSLETSTMKEIDPRQTSNKTDDITI